MDKDLMILEAMNNQYLIAEHYYDLTEYIDKNIYKFRRNGKYLQEGFGTVALWIAGIALAAGIGWWVYKKFFDKKQNDSNESKVKQEIAVAQESETATNEVNSQLQLENKLLSEKEFLTNQKFNEALKKLQEDYKNQNINNDEAYNRYIDLNATLLKEELPNSKLTDGAIKKLLKSTLKKPKNGKDTSNIIQKFGTEIKGIYDYSINFVENVIGSNDATTVYQKSLTMALYYMNYFLCVDILLSNEQNQNDNITKNYKNFQLIETTTTNYIKSIQESQENIKNAIQPKQFENIYSTINLTPETLKKFEIPGFPTITNFNNFKVDDYAQLDVNEDSLMKTCFKITNISKKKQVTNSPATGGSSLPSGNPAGGSTPTGGSNPSNPPSGGSGTSSGGNNPNQVNSHAKEMSQSISNLAKYSVVFQDANIIEFLKLPWITYNTISLLNEAEKFIQDNLNDQLKNLYDQQTDPEGIPLFTQCYIEKGSYGEESDQANYKKKVFTLFSILWNNTFKKEFGTASTPFNILFGDLYEILLSDWKLFEFNSDKINASQEFNEFYKKFQQDHKLTEWDKFIQSIPEDLAKIQSAITTAGTLASNVGKALGAGANWVMGVWNKINGKGASPATPNASGSAGGNPSATSSNRTIDDVRNDIRDLINKYSNNYPQINIDPNNDLTDERIKTRNDQALEQKILKMTDKTSEEYRVYKKFLDLINEGKQILNNSAGGNAPSSGNSQTTQSQQQNTTTPAGNSSSGGSGSSTGSGGGTDSVQDFADELDTLLTILKTSDLNKYNNIIRSLKFWNPSLDEHGDIKTQVANKIQFDGYPDPKLFNSDDVKNLISKFKP